MRTPTELDLHQVCAALAHVIAMLNQLGLPEGALKNLDEAMAQLEAVTSRYT